MNPANPDFYNRSNSSPALFNRCVIDWFGDWPQEALLQVAADFTKKTQISQDAFVKPGLTEEARGETLAGVIVEMHEKVEEVNDQLRKAAMKHNFITPRDFLDFINHFLEFNEEKRQELVEQQNHIGGGLQKLRETETQVAELQKGLSVKEADLTQKNKEAEAKMSQMVKGQGEAEERKASSMKLSEELDKQSKVIAERSQEVQNRMAEVVPLIEEAKKAVGAVNRGALDEMRNLPNPPPGVKLAMEAVVTMTRPEVGTATWDVCKKVMRDSSFIASILAFDTEQMKDSTRIKVQKHCLDSPEWDFDKIKRASTTAVSLAKWVHSQINYGELLKQMEPMRMELQSMQAEAKKNKEKFEEQQAEVTNMEDRIKQFKAEYAVLIRGVEMIKSEMQEVKDKCDRSKQLLKDLSSEKARWEDSSRGFQEQGASVIGDALITGAFCTFIGFFDLSMRQQLMRGWREDIADCGIMTKPDLSVIEYMSKPSERLQWKNNSLPDDDLCYENAIILKRFIRYPLIIDPSGQAITWMTNEFKDKRLMKTSFADVGFMKHLESALRFGAPLLVMDVDKIDPILNNVLNKETHKQGPRILISLGESDIDFSPAFQMYMCTRDSSVQFTPDLCSRVTFVNFTITPSSLQSQCMNALLKSERPDVDKKRADMLKLQGEFKVKIRALEDNLLQALSEVEGSILEDVKVIATLEKIKKESSEIEQQVAQTNEVMNEIEQSSAMYDPPGQQAASIFFLLDSMGSVNPFYRYSLAFFFDIFTQAFKENKELDAAPKDDYPMRLQVIIRMLFRNAFTKISLGLQDADVLVYALRLAQVRADHEEPLPTAEVDLLLKGAAVDVLKSPTAAPLAQQCQEVLKTKLNAQQLKGLQELHLLPCFAGLVGHIKSNESVWMKFMDHLEPEKNFPEGWRTPDDASGANARAVQEALVLKALRPDRLVLSLQKLVELILGSGNANLSAFDLAEIVGKDSKASSPIMMVSAPGFDPSGKVTDLAASMGKQLTSTAMGTEDGFKIADRAIAAASKSGSWVLLKNIHLAIKWLTELEKTMYGMNPHINFRLFVTLEFHPRVPANLVRLSRVYIFEPPSGVKASMQRSFAQVLTTEKTDKRPVERCRLHFLLAFLHATVLERLRYFPVGWSKKYEFSDADQACGRDIIDAWLDSVTNGGQVTNISPDKIPWDAIKAVLTDAIYGGRLDNEFDQRVLKSFVDHLFCEECFNSDFSLNLGLSKDQRLPPPDGIKREQFTNWVESLAVKGSPAWIGLPVHAEQMLRINRAKHTLARWVTLSGSSHVPSRARGGGSAKGRSSISVKNPLGQLAAKVELMLEKLPQEVLRLERSEASLSDPLWRCFDREMGFGRDLLARLRADLERLKGVCAGEVKTTNDLRQLMHDMNTDAIPKQWRRYTVPDITVTEWLSDFVRRCKQLEDLHRSGNFQKQILWLGGLFFPEAFLTASRQYVAQQMKLSLEELLMVTDIGAQAEDSQSFMVKGAYMEGAAWDTKGAQLTMTDELSVALPEVRIRWTHRDSAEYKQAAGYLKLPVYLSAQRANIVCSVNLRAPENVPSSLWVQRAACLTLWTKQ